MQTVVAIDCSYSPI